MLPFFHSYPADLADYVIRHWNSCSGEGNPLGLPAIDARIPPPERAQLEGVISVCYQASLVQEEGRRLRFRVIMIDAGQMDSPLPPPFGLRPIEFEAPLPFNEKTLRRLAPAASLERSLIGLGAGPLQELRVWGLVHCGSHWVKAIKGLHRGFYPLPVALVVGVHGPGLLTVAKGHFVLARLVSGSLSAPSLGHPHENWLTGITANERARLHILHDRARRLAQQPWATIEPGFLLLMMQQNARLIVNAIRSSNHGGMLLSLPRRIAENPEALARYVNMKHIFRDPEPRRQFQQLVLHAMNTLAEVCGNRHAPGKTVGWSDYLLNEDIAMARAKEAIAEYAQLVADLAAVDGAVVVIRPLEVVGFGGVISGALKSVETVARAMDEDGDEILLESTSEVGTRHRAAYRLCQSLHDALALAISQDGEVRMIRWKNNHVTYWDQFSSGLLDI
jgi:hypothetical protein